MNRRNFLKRAGLSPIALAAVVAAQQGETASAQPVELSGQLAQMESAVVEHEPVAIAHNITSHSITHERLAQTQTGVMFVGLPNHASEARVVFPIPFSSRPNLVLSAGDGLPICAAQVSPGGFIVCLDAGRITNMSWLAFGGDAMTNRGVEQ